MSSLAPSMPASRERLAGVALRSAWNDLKARRKGVRARDSADELGVSEAELIASLIGAGATRLKTDGAKIIMDLPALGQVMALTRNEACVHEKIGPYTDVSINPGHGLVLGDKIDLRIFPAHWRNTFALVEDTDSGPRRSLQVFDAAGTAVHKIYQKPATDIAAFDALIGRWRADDQNPTMSVLPPLSKRGDRPDSEIDVESLRAHWAALQDTHDFFGLLRDHDVGRRQAMRLAGRDFTRQVQTTSLASLLEAARDAELPIMVFVGNQGCIQIHTGPVMNLKRMGPWFNVLDPDFNLHLREDQIDSAWVVRKPTRDGDVTSLELFDKDGFCFAQLFGARKPGKPELQAWRDLLAALPDRAASH
jgi:putative hemin transport protein